MQASERSHKPTKLPWILNVQIVDMEFEDVFVHIQNFQSDTGTGKYME